MSLVHLWNKEVICKGLWQADISGPRENFSGFAGYCIIWAVIWASVLGGLSGLREQSHSWGSWRRWWWQCHIRLCLLGWHELSRVRATAFLAGIQDWVSIQQGTRVKTRSWAGGQSDQMVAQFPGVSVHLQEPWTNHCQILLTCEEVAANILTDWAISGSGLRRGAVGCGRDSQGLTRMDTIFYGFGVSCKNRPVDRK